MTISVAASAAFRTSIRMAAALMAGALISIGAPAQSLGTAFSDLWWNPAESGWGVNIAHQHDAMFLTFFIYRADNTPYWVVGILERKGSNPLTAPPLVFSGDVYETRGPAFNVPFIPAQATNRKVGTATFSGSTTAGTLEYSIDGITVKKDIVRQTLRNIDYTGQYLGSAVHVSSECANSANNNAVAVDSGTITVVQQDTAISLTSTGKTRACTYRGTYSQQGALGQVDAGTYSCDDGTLGTFTLSGVQWTASGMTAALSGKNASCSIQGYLGGIAKATATYPAQWATRGFVASPDVYQLVAQTEQNVIFTAVWKPGQRDQFHSHPMGSAQYWVTDCSLRVRSPDGTETINSHPAGTALFFDVASHSAENITSSPCVVVFTEPKS